MCRVSLDAGSTDPHGAQSLQGLEPQVLWCMIIPSLLLRFTGSHKKAVSWEFWENQLTHKHTHKPH